MSANEPLYRLFGLDCAVSKKEGVILEAEFFIHLYHELNEYYRSDYRNYFRLMRFNQEMENTMLESTFMQNIIKDVVSTGDYTLEGIARCTNIPEEVICEIATGKNTNPSFQSSRKIIELHRTIRMNLYHEIARTFVLNHTKENE